MSLRLPQINDPKKQLKQQVNGWKQDCGEDLKILLKKSACKDPKDFGHKNRWNISTNNMDTWRKIPTSKKWQQIIDELGLWSL